MRIDTQHIPFLVPCAAWNTGFVPSWRDHAVNYVGNYPQSWGYVTRADGTQVWTNASIAGGEFDGNDTVVEPLMAPPPPFGTIVPSSSFTYSSPPSGTMPSLAFEQAYPTAPYQLAQYPAQPSSTYSSPPLPRTMSPMRSVASQYAVRPTANQSQPMAESGSYVMTPPQFAQHRTPSTMSIYSPPSPPDTMSSMRSVASQYAVQPTANQPQPMADSGSYVMAPPQFAQHRTPSPPSTYPSPSSGTMPSMTLVASQNGTQQIVHQTQPAYGMAPPQFAQHRTPSPPSTYSPPSPPDTMSSMRSVASQYAVQPTANQPQPMADSGSYVMAPPQFAQHRTPSPPSTYPSPSSGTMPSMTLVASQNGTQQIFYQPQPAYDMAPPQFAQHSSYYPTLPPNHLPPGPEDPSLTMTPTTPSTPAGSFGQGPAPPLTTSYAGPITPGPVLPVLPAATQIAAPPQALPHHEPECVFNPLITSVFN